MPPFTVVVVGNPETASLYNIDYKGKKEKRDIGYHESWVGARNCTPFAKRGTITLDLPSIIHSFHIAPVIHFHL